MLQTHTAVTTTRSHAKVPAKRVEIIQPQDHLLRDVVKLIEAEKRERHFTWGWLSQKSELTPSGYYGWRSGKTRGVWLRRVNSVLKPLGYRLQLVKLK